MYDLTSAVQGTAGGAEGRPPPLPLAVIVAAADQRDSYKRTIVVKFFMH